MSNPGYLDAAAALLKLHGIACGLYPSEDSLGLSTVIRQYLDLAASREDAVDADVVGTQPYSAIETPRHPVAGKQEFFEAAFAGDHFSKEGTDYANPYVQSAWEGFLRGATWSEMTVAYEAAKKQAQRRCNTCRSPREGGTCFKCGSPTSVPCASWEEPCLPPIDLIRSLAREVGYAIGVHGSQERDFDIIAAPWAPDAVDSESLIAHLCKGLKAKQTMISHRPHGRCSVILQVEDAYMKVIDLSILPITNSATSPSASQGTLKKKKSTGIVPHFPLSFS